MTFSDQNDKRTITQLSKKIRKVKKIALLLSLSCSLLSAQAQWQIGAKAGPNLTNFRFSSGIYETNLVPGFLIGGFARYVLSENMSVQGELFYSKEGNKWTIPQMDRTARIRSGQLRIPILFQYKVAEGIVLEAGFQGRLLLAMSQKIDGSDKQDIREYYKTLAPGLQAGCSYRFSGKLDGLDIALRYSSELGAVNKDDVDAGSLKSYGFSLSAGWILWKK